MTERFNILYSRRELDSKNRFETYQLFIDGGSKKDDPENWIENYDLIIDGVHTLRRTTFNSVNIECYLNNISREFAQALLNKGFNRIEWNISKIQLDLEKVICAYRRGDLGREKAIGFACLAYLYDKINVIFAESVQNN